MAEREGNRLYTLPVEQKEKEWELKGMPGRSQKCQSCRGKRGHEMPNQVVEVNEVDQGEKTVLSVKPTLPATLCLPAYLNQLIDSTGSCPLGNHQVYVYGDTPTILTVMLPPLRITSTGQSCLAASKRLRMVAAKCVPPDFE